MVGTIDHAGILAQFEEAVVGGIGTPFHCLAIGIEPIAWGFTGIVGFALGNLAIVHLELPVLESLEDLIGGHLEGIAERLAYIDLFRALPVGIASPGQVDVLGEVFRLTFGSSLRIDIFVDDNVDLEEFCLAVGIATELHGKLVTGMETVG